MASAAKVQQPAVALDVGRQHRSLAAIAGYGAHHLDEDLLDAEGEAGAV
jgi:hypothetical protein